MPKDPRTRLFSNQVRSAYEQVFGDDFVPDEDEDGEVPDGPWNLGGVVVVFEVENVRDETENRVVMVHDCSDALAAGLVGQAYGIYTR